MTTKHRHASQIVRAFTAAQRAYTAVEVMLSIVVLGIGAAGVMSMQKASIQGNNDARMMDMANSIAREWQERLRRDAMTWTQPDENGGTENWSSNTFLITQIASGHNPGSFQNVTAPSTGYTTAMPSGYSRAFDILGRDVAFNGTNYPNAVFCAQVRADWLLQDQLLRTTVRVYWLQQMFTAPAASSAFCVSDTPDTNSASAYHFIYTTTAVRRTPGT
jgi:prepilin-type N-terminal cleavage/methylation domain-containing protein